MKPYFQNTLTIPIGKLIACTLLLALTASCSLLPSKSGGEVKFTKVEQEADAVGRWRVPASMSIKLDMPQDNGNGQDKILKGIRDIIATTEVGKVFGLPVVATQDRYADFYCQKFKEAIGNGELDAGATYCMEIEKSYQDDNFLCFRVSDGIFGNGGPTQNYYVLRKSDGKLINQNEIIDIPQDSLVALAVRYSTEEVNPYDLEGEFHQFVPTVDGGILHYMIGSHFWNDVHIPVNDLQPYLTSLGSELFGIEAPSPIALLSTKWWAKVLSWLHLPKTESRLPLYLLLGLLAVGAGLLGKKKRMSKVIWVGAVGMLEIYYFGFSSYTPIWFYSVDYQWYLRLLFMAVGAALIVVQCVVTDEIFLRDNLYGKEREKANVQGGMSLFLLFALFAAFISHVVVEWIGDGIILTIVNWLSYIVLAFFLYLSIGSVMEDDVNKGNLSSVQFIVPWLIGTIGVLVVMSWCPWTVLIAAIVLYCVFIEKTGEAEFSQIRDKAQNGDSEQMRQLGRCYLKGLHVNPNDTEAVKWFQKAVDAGNVKAYRNLSYCYYNGRGVAKDLRKSMEMARKGYELGDANAADNIAVLYQSEEFGKNTAEVHKWLLNGAEAGSSRCRIKLGLDYMNGYTVAIDLNEAARWFKAIIDDEKEDKEALGNANYYYGEVLYKLGNVREAQKYIRKAQQMGDKMAKEFGHLYLK